jgi:transposase-like protein
MAATTTQGSPRTTDPRTLLEAVRYFSDPEVALDFVRRAVWAEGTPVCPHCGSREAGFVASRRIWKCKARECRKQFSAKVGTIFEDSPLGWDKWLPAVWLIANSKNSISSHELARALGVTQKTSWFMLHRIRDAMTTGTFRKLDGEVEADETFIGGKAGNMHKGRWEAGRGSGQNKTIIAGMVERGGEVRAKKVERIDAATLTDNLLANVEIGADVFTDELVGYNELEQYYAHKTVDHSREYVRGIAHTNTIENFWSLLKRAIKGTQVHVSAEHLERYVTERSFAYNNRGTSDLGRMQLAMSGAQGRRLTWDELTAR